MNDRTWFYAGPRGGGARCGHHHRTSRAAARCARRFEFGVVRLFRRGRSYALTPTTAYRVTETGELVA